MDEPFLERNAKSLRRALTLLCALGLIAALGQLWAERSELRGLQSFARESGAVDDGADLPARIAGESDSLHARLIAGRAAIYHVLNVHGRKAAAADRQRAEAALPRARQLLREVLAAQPSNWQAAMLLGTGHYLEWSLRRDRRLFTDSPVWERPLTLAVEAGQGHPEPKRLLATAYLEVWRALSPAKKEKARALLKEVFRDDFRAFQALSPTWLAIGGSQEETFAVIPPDPDAWTELERTYAGRRDWRSVMAAYEKRMAALAATFERRRREAEERIRLGDSYNGRALLLQNLVEAPTSRRFVPEVAASLASYPPGLHGVIATEKLREWLTFVLELDRVDVHPFEPALLPRLIDAAGDLPPEVGAHAALLAGDIYQAERFERLTESFQLDDWGPYLVAKARWALARQDVATARQALDLASIGWRRQLPYLELRQKVASSAPGGMGSPFAPVPLAPAVLERTEWMPAEWQMLRRRPVLELYAGRAARGLAIEIVEAPDYGTVVEISLDGMPVKLAIVHTGDVVRVGVQVERRLHQLDIRPLVTAEVVGGRVRLIE
jgi:hypothetical protein